MRHGGQELSMRLSPRTTRLLLPFAAALTLAVSSCSERPVHWQTYQPHGSPLSVEMPAEPTVQKRSLDFNYGIAPVETAVCELSDDEAYLASEVTLPRGRSPYTEQELLDRVIEGITKSQKVTCGRARDIRLGAYRGVEHDVVVDKVAKGALRIYLVEGKIYLLMAAGRDRGSYREREDHFFKSISLNAPNSKSPKS